MTRHSTDDSEVVVLEGSVGSGIRSIEFGESTSDVEDWDVVSFDGLDSGVSIDLSQVDSNYDVTATVPGTGVEGVEGTESTPDSLPDGISVSDGIKTLGSNGHYYEVVTTAMTWSDAKAYAESFAYDGQQGYLVTITSSQENTDVYNALRANGNHNEMAWLGGNDAAVQGEFVWDGGPEAGINFVNGHHPNEVPVDDGSGGTYFSNFTEHVNPGTDEHYLVMSSYEETNYYTGGKWMDSAGDIAQQFVIEYGGQNSIIFLELREQLVLMQCPPILLPI